MTESELDDALFQVSVLTAEKGNFERSNTALIAQVTKLEKRITELHATNRSIQTENEALKSRCDQYQRAYQELSQRLGTYDTQLIARLEDRTRKAEAELRRLQSESSRKLTKAAGDEQRDSESSRESMKRSASAGIDNSEMLKVELEKTKKQVEVLVDQLTTEISNSMKTQEAFHSLKEKYQALYRESREDAVSYPIPAPDPQDTPRLPCPRPSLLSSQCPTPSHRRFCSHCGQSLPAK